MSVLSKEIEEELATRLLEMVETSINKHEERKEQLT